MDKKTIIIAVICIVLAFSWQAILTKLYPPPKSQPGSQPVATNTTMTATNVVAQTHAPAPVAERSAEEAKPTGMKAETPRPEEQLATLENDRVKLAFTSYGGGIRRVELKQYPTRKGASDRVILNQFGAAPIGEVTGLSGFDTNTTYDLKQGDQTITFEAVDEEGVKVTKLFRLGKDYLIDGEITVVNHSQKPMSQAKLSIALGTASVVVPTDKFEIPYLDLSDGKTAQFVDPSAFNASWLGRRPAREAVHHDDAHVAWAGIEDRFFCALWMPQVATGQVSVASVSATRRVVPQPGCDPSRPRPSDYGITGVLTMPAANLAVGASQSYSFKLYAGPKEYVRLQALGQGQGEVMHWGWFEWMAELLLKTMTLLDKVVPNYFFVIILITLVIKLVFWPLTAMSNRNMKAMQALQPKMTALREKFKDEPQKLNAEVMKMYKEHKVNPMAGCLPTVVQIPVFIGFYYMLRSAIELRGHGFLWIGDLSQPDTVGMIGTFALNPLPIMMGATMIWQMKTTPSAGDPAQQKMMMLMPLMFLFFCYGMPSGLVLYWTVQNLFTIFQMIRTKHSVPAPATAAAAAAPVKTQKSKPR